MSLKMGNDVVVPFSINQTDLLAGTPQDIPSPVDGFVNSISVAVQVAVGTGGVIKAAVGTTDVVGATVTVEDSATKGTTVSATSTSGNSTRIVAKGGRIQIIPAAEFATSGAVNGHIVINTGS